MQWPGQQPTHLAGSDATSTDSTDISAQDAAARNARHASALGGHRLKTASAHIDVAHQRRLGSVSSEVNITPSLHVRGRTRRDEVLEQILTASDDSSCVASSQEQRTADSKSLSNPGNHAAASTPADRPVPGSKNPSTHAEGVEEGRDPALRIVHGESKPASGHSEQHLLPADSSIQDSRDALEQPMAVQPSGRQPAATSALEQPSWSHGNGDHGHDQSRTERRSQPQSMDSASANSAPDCRVVSSHGLISHLPRMVGSFRLPPLWIQVPSGAVPNLQPASGISEDKVPTQQMPSGAAPTLQTTSLPATQTSPTQSQAAAAEAAMAGIVRTQASDDKLGSSGVLPTSAQPVVTSGSSGLQDAHIGVQPLAEQLQELPQQLPPERLEALGADLSDDAQARPILYQPAPSASLSATTPHSPPASPPQHGAANPGPDQPDTSHNPEMGRPDQPRPAGPSARLEVHVHDAHEPGMVPDSRAKSGHLHLNASGDTRDLNTKRIEAPQHDQRLPRMASAEPLGPTDGSCVGSRADHDAAAGGLEAVSQPHVPLTISRDPNGDTGHASGLAEGLLQRQLWRFPSGVADKEPAAVLEAAAGSASPASSASSQMSARPDMPNVGNAPPLDKPGTQAWTLTVGPVGPKQSRAAAGTEHGHWDGVHVQQAEQQGVLLQSDQLGRARQAHQQSRSHHPPADRASISTSDMQGNLHTADLQAHPIATQQGMPSGPGGQAADVTMSAQPGSLEEVGGMRQSFRQPRAHARRSSARRALHTGHGASASGNGRRGSDIRDMDSWPGVHALDCSQIQQQQQQVCVALTARQLRHALMSSWDLSDPLLQSTSISSYASTEPFSEASAMAAPDEPPAHEPSVSSSSMSSEPTGQLPRPVASQGLADPSSVTGQYAQAPESAASSSLSSEPSKQLPRASAIAQDKAPAHVPLVSSSSLSSEPMRQLPRALKFGRDSSAARQHAQNASSCNSSSDESSDGASQASDQVRAVRYQQQRRQAHAHRGRQMRLPADAGRMTYSTTHTLRPRGDASGPEPSSNQMTKPLPGSDEQRSQAQQDSRKTEGQQPHADGLTDGCPSSHGKQEDMILRTLNLPDAMARGDGNPESMSLHVPATRTNVMQRVPARRRSEGSSGQDASLVRLWTCLASRPHSAGPDCGYPADASPADPSERQQGGRSILSPPIDASPVDLSKTSQAGVTILSHLINASPVDVSTSSQAGRIILSHPITGLRRPQLKSPMSHADKAGPGPEQHVVHESAALVFTASPEASRMPTQLQPQLQLQPASAAAGASANASPLKAQAASAPNLRYSLSASLRSSVITSGSSELGSPGANVQLQHLEPPERSGRQGKRQEANEGDLAAIWQKLGR